MKLDFLDISKVHERTNRFTNNFKSRPYRYVISLKKPFSVIKYITNMDVIHLVNNVECFLILLSLFSTQTPLSVKLFEQKNRLNNLEIGIACFEVETSDIIIIFLQLSCFRTFTNSTFSSNLIIRSDFFWVLIEINGSLIPCSFFL
jgi:hypothetical protein